MRLLKAMHENERFSSTEQAVIKYILAQPKEIVDLSIRELAEQTFTSPAAIFRLCQKLNLKGYTEFKIKFISEINRTTNIENPIVERPITDKDTPDTVMRKMAALEIEAIEETKNEMDMDQLKRIADWLEGARIIDFYAFDENYYIAQMTAYNFLQIKKTAVINLAANSQYMQALAADKTHVAVILSRTGENKRLIEIARILKERGVKILLLSTARKSTLDGLCDEFLYIANMVEYLDMGGIIFSVGVRYYLDVLFGLLLSRNYREIEAMYSVFEDRFGRIYDPWRLW